MSAALRVVASVQFPVEAVEWYIHAATTIKDASGAVVAECSGHGRDSDEDVAIAAEIVRRLNAHEQLLDVVEFLVRWHDQLKPADIRRAQAVIAQVAGARS